MAGLHAVVMPKWGLAIAGEVMGWRLDEGANVTRGDVLVDIKTAKITNPLAAACSGILVRQLASIGDSVVVGALLGIIAESSASDDEIEGYISRFTPEEDPHALEPAEETNVRKSLAALAPELQEVASILSEADPSKSTPAEASTISVDGAQSPTTPAARKLARQLGVSLSKITPTGKLGRISKRDVENAAAAMSRTNGGAAALEAPAIGNDIDQSGNYEVIKLTGGRRASAKRLSASKQTAPHFRLSIDVNLDELLSARRKLNATHPQSSVSINDFIIKSAAMSLMQVPDVNIQFDGEVIKRFKAADIAVAVASEGRLIAPVIRSANEKGLAQISREMKDLSERVRLGKLRASEIQGGTFSISNLGVLGIQQFDAVINSPQGAILAVGQGRQRALVVNEELTVATMMSVTLCCDHRVIDGALGAKFLQAFKGFVELPATMLL